MDKYHYLLPSANFILQDHHDEKASESRAYFEQNVREIFVANDPSSRNIILTNTAKKGCPYL